MGAASPGRGVPARHARRHRERPTAAPAPPHLPRWKEKARLPRTPLRQGRLFGGTGQRGGVELPGAAGVVGTQKAATAATRLPSLLVFFCLGGGLRGPVAAVAGVGFRTVRPCAGEVGGTATTQKEAESARPVARQPAATPTASTAAFPASLRRRGSSPSAPACSAGALRLGVLSPSAAGRSAADTPGPPRHHVAPRGVRRYRRNASRLQSGTP